MNFSYYYNEKILSIKDTILNYQKHSQASDEKINSTIIDESESN